MAAARAAQRRPHGQRDPQAAEPRPRHGRPVARRNARSSTTSRCAARPKCSTAISRATSPRRCSGSTAWSAISRRRERPGRPTCCSTICSAKRPGVPGAWGHAIGGMGSITQAMAKAVPRGGRRHRAQHAGRGSDRRRAAARRASSPAARRGARRASIAGVNPKLLFDRLVPHGAVDAGRRARGCTAGNAKARPSG